MSLFISGGDKPKITDVGKKLRAYRRDHQMTLREMADQLYISVPQLCAIEFIGRAEPNLTTAAKIHDLYGI